MHHHRAKSLSLLFFALALFTGVIMAASDPIAVVRISSLDALKADAEQLAGAVHGEEAGADLMQPLTEILQFPGAELLDTKSPLTLVFPMEGMMLGEKGLIAILPLHDPDGTLAGILESREGSEKGESGEFFFKSGDGTEIAAMIHGSHLILGQNRSLVGSFDAGAALAVTNLPPGNIAIEINLEPLTPMIEMGLQSGRQMMQQQMENSTDADGAEDDAPPGPEALGGMMDLYFNLLRDIVLNTSRIQFSLELTQEDILVHNRWLPRSGSTLEGLLRAQSGNLPDLTRLIDSSSGFGAMAGQITLTPAFQEALNGFSQGYFQSIGSLLGSTGMGEGNESFAAIFASMEQSFQKVTACYGDHLGFGGTFGIGADEGLRFNQISKISNVAACSTFIDEMAGALQQVPQDSEQEPMISLIPNAFNYRGVDVTRQTVRLMPPGSPGSDEEMPEMLKSLFGEDGMISYYGMTTDYMVTVAGKNAEMEFKSIVDRIQAGSKVQARMSGLTSDYFQPIRTGPGFFAAVDLKSLIASIATFAPQDDLETTSILAILGTMPDSAGRIVEGMRFDPDAVHITFGIRLELLEMFGKLAEMEKGAEEYEEHVEHKTHDHGDV